MKDRIRPPFKMMDPDTLRIIWKSRCMTASECAKLVPHTAGTISKWRRMTTGASPITLRNVEVIPPDVMAECHKLLDFNLIDNKRYKGQDAAEAISRAIAANIAMKLNVHDQNDTIPEPVIESTPEPETIPAITSGLNMISPELNWLMGHAGQVAEVEQGMIDLFAAGDRLQASDAIRVLGMTNPIHGNAVKDLLRQLSILRESMSMVQKSH